MPDPLDLFRERADWAPARGALAALIPARQGVVNARVAGFAAAYRGNRAAMVLDVVMSRQRRYARVLPLVQGWVAANPGASLAQLAATGPAGLAGLRANEAQTIVGVADGLSRYCNRHGLKDDAGTAAWAQRTESVRFAWRLDPYAGCVSGIGIALFAYLRMLAGADGIKPDLRVRRALQNAGLSLPPGDDAAVLAAAEGMAQELGVTRLFLDQLLW